LSARFSGLSCVVTGAASGIGRATARLIAGEGGRLIALDVSDRVEETAAGFDSIVPMRGDAGNEADVKAMIALAVERHGGLDVVCANAGISGGFAGLFEQSVDDWTEILRINLIGAFLA